jgi:hypothetical protein
MIPESAVLIVELFASLHGSVERPIEAAVSQLGARSDINSVEEVARFGCEAVPYLTRRLHTVDNRKINFNNAEQYPREMQVLWSIASLRYISGKDFYATKRKSIGQDAVGRQMLRMGAPRGMTKLFGIWMSRGTIYFASEGEQTEIIRKWRKYGASHTCQTSQQSGRKISFWLYGVTR